MWNISGGPYRTRGTEFTVLRDALLISNSMSKPRSHDVDDAATTASGSSHPPPRRKGEQARKPLQHPHRHRSSGTRPVSSRVVC
eukprot:4605876-Prymnesium_polylepis.2